MEALNARAWRFFAEADFVILDTETTGLDPKSPEIEVVEIAILDHEGQTLLNTLVKPVNPIPAKATGIHGITDTMVADAPTFVGIYPAIEMLCRKKTIIVYNAGYDITLLLNLARRHSLDVSSAMTKKFCLMRAYADYHKAPGRYRGNYAWQSLGKAYEQQFHCVFNDTHRALADAQAAYKLLKHLAERSGVRL